MLVKIDLSYSPLFCFSFDVIPDEISKNVRSRHQHSTKKTFQQSWKTDEKPQNSFHWNYWLLPIKYVSYQRWQKSIKNLSGCKLPNLIANWDILKVANGVINVVGYLLPEENTHKAGPNARRFIRRPMGNSSSARFYSKFNFFIKGSKAD